MNPDHSREKQKESPKTLVYCAWTPSYHNKDRKCILPEIVLEMTRDNTSELVCTNQKHDD